ncbi:MAG TPA: cytochrome-c oxidase [Ureibacillus sp.]|nr:cytochrome-c oxidase [Ureibacillus sp.]
MGTRFIKIAGVYFVLAVTLGLVMGIIQNFAFTSVHAHLNLLGWVSMALFGLIYSVYKKAGETTLAKAHFWLHNIGLPIMQGSLFIEILTGNSSLTVGIIIGSLIVILGVLLFVLNLFINLSEK